MLTKEQIEKDFQDYKEQKKEKIREITVGKNCQRKTQKICES